jgi:hypothetical protein
LNKRPNAEHSLGRFDREETMSGPGAVAGDQLHALVERIEHVEEEIRTLTSLRLDVAHAGAMAARALVPR